MNKRILTRTAKWIAMAVASIAFSPRTSAQGSPDKPNVILILSDDLGLGDIGPYGQDKIQTPSLDKMAKEGMLFTQAYATPLCAPSRSTLITGLHSGHAPIRHNPAAAHGWNRTTMGDPPIPDDMPTFAKLYKQAGYSTAIIGKWGMGYPGKAGSPDRLGFDYFFGYDSHVAAHEYYPDHLWKNDEKYPLDGKTYSHDLFTKEAFNFVREHKDNPFMIYLAYTIPHVHLDPPSLAPYENKDWPKPEKAFAAMVTRMDGDIGKLFDLLKELKIDNNTIVFFMSDNGSERAGGHSAKFFNSMGDLRGLKNTPYEGGARVPLIVRWPGHVAPGSKTDQLFAIWDFMATSADITHQPRPKTDGVSIMPTLLGHPEQQKQEPYLYWELNVQGGFQEIRMGDWKGERLNVASKDGAKLELYNLKTDPSEKDDVAAEHPDIVKKMNEIAIQAHTPSKIFPLFYDEVQSAPPTMTQEERKAAKAEQNKKKATPAAE